MIRLTRGTSTILTSSKGDIRALPEDVAVFCALLAALGASRSYPVFFVRCTFARPRGRVELVVARAFAASSGVC